MVKSRIDKLEYKFEIINKSKYYYKNNKFHRDNDLPAIIRKDGSRGWLKNGRSHRDNNKPSTIFSDGRMYWHENGNYIKGEYNEIKNK